MSFSSILFVFYFLPISLACYYIAPKKWRNAVFLCASLFFYAWGEPRFVLLLLLSIFANHRFGLQVGREAGEHRKAWLVAALVFNLGFLCVFKYTNFIADNLGALIGMSFSVPKLPLPLGISFYTFQAISYVVDVYRGDAAPQRQVRRVAYYIAAFPHLMLGPIVRFPDVEDQLTCRPHSAALFAEGVSRFLVGLSKKVLLSDSLAAVANAMFKLRAEELTTASAWLGIVCYTLQIYFDFGGYSDMAIGLGKMFGFSFKENFNYPYVCKSVKDFWRRWHMSLSSWFRDYVYIPLGGNRCSAARQVGNLLLVWLLTGLWHGAAWTFIAWGVYYGALLLLERHWEPLRARLPAVLQHGYAMLAVMVGWVFFRAGSLGQAGMFLKAMFGFSAAGAVDATAWLHLHDSALLLAVAVFASTPLAKKGYDALHARLGQGIAFPVRVLGGMAALLLCTLYLANATYNPFIYFRF